MNKELENADLRIPKNIDAEKSIISCLLQNNVLINEVVAIINYDMFYDPIYRAMFKSICELDVKGSGVDMITLKNKVIPKANGESKTENVILNRINYIRKHVIEQGFDVDRLNDDFFIDIIRHAVLTTNVLDYCKIVKEKYMLRKALMACENLETDIIKGEKDAETILMETQDELFNLAKRTDMTSYEKLSKGAFEVLKEIEASAKIIDGVTGVRTGYKFLDSITYGFQKQNMIVIGARPGVGKTAFALNLAQGITSIENQRVLFFALEMGRNELLRRTISMETGISGNQLRMGSMLRDEQWVDIINAIKRTDSLNIYVDADPYLTIAELRNKCKKFHSEINPSEVKDIVIIDYLQLMHAGNIIKNGSYKAINTRAEEIAEISRNVKAIAKELDIPIIALVQLNRLVDYRKDKLPQLADIRESGSIEQDADIVMFMHSFKDDPDQIEKDITEIIFAKNRAGENGVIKYKFDGATMKFKEKNDYIGTGD